MRSATPRLQARQAETRNLQCAIIHIWYRVAGQLRSSPIPRSLQRNRMVPSIWRRGAARASRKACPQHAPQGRSEEHTSELQTLMRISYAVFSLKKKKHKKTH